MFEAKQRAIDLWRQRGPEIGSFVEPPVDEEAVRACQGRLKLEFPTELLEWLRVCNGACTNTWAETFLGVASKPRRHEGIEGLLVDGYPEWLERRWIPFAGDGCGDYFLLVRAEGRGTPAVMFWDHERTLASEVTYVVASSLWHFLANVLDPASESGDVEVSDPWPFDKAYTLARDPELALIRGFSMAWE